MRRHQATSTHFAREQDHPQLFARIKNSAVDEAAAAFGEVTCIHRMPGRRAGKRGQRLPELQRRAVFLAAAKDPAVPPGIVAGHRDGAGPFQLLAELGRKLHVARQ